MSLEQAFRTYITFFDGTEKDFSEVENLFDSIYHDDFMHDMDGCNPVNKEKLRFIMSNAAAMGSKTELLEFNSISSNAVQFRFRIKNSQIDSVIHNVAEIKDGKIAKVVSIDGTVESLLRARYISELFGLEQAFRAYFACFDGSKRVFSEVENLFDNVYHDEFVHEMDGNPVNKGKLRVIMTNFFALGSKVTILEFKVVSFSCVAFKFRLTNAKIDKVVHNLAVVKDNKFVKVQSVDGTLDSLVKARSVSDFYGVENKIKAFFNFYDGEIKPFEKVEKAFDEVYHEDFVNTMNGRPIDKDKMRLAAEVLLSEGTQVELVTFKPMDCYCFEAKLRVVNKSIVMEGHSKGIVKDGRLLRIEPFEDSASEYGRLGTYIKESIVSRETGKVVSPDADDEPSAAIAQ